MYETIEVSSPVDGGVLRILLNRPKGNIVTTAMLGEIADALARHRSDPHLRLVFLRGAGGHFSFGASVEEHRRDSAPALLREFHGFVRFLAAYPVPIAALVEGKCLGGGFEIALCCHLIFASANASFGCPEIKLGVFPPVLAAIGANRLGAPLAERLILTGEEVDAATLQRAGIVAAIFEDDAEGGLLSWFQTRLAPLSGLAIREATHAIRRNSGLLALLAAPLAEIERQYVERVLPSHDGNDGIEAFLARRPPVWRDA